jgi:hypothetical protein
LAVARSLLRAEERKLLAVEDAVIGARERCRTWRWRLIAGALAAWGLLFFVPVGVGPVRDRLHGMGWLELVPMIGLLLGFLLLTMARGCNVRCHHAEYALRAREHGDRSRSTRERRRDDRIVSREDAYEGGAGAMRALLTVIVIALIISAFDWPYEGPGIRTICVWIAIGLLLVTGAWISSGRLAHSRSIRYYRRIERASTTAA